MIDFKKYEFRCSQLSKIGGKLYSSSSLDSEINDLLEEKTTLKSKTGRSVKWTESKQEKLDSKIYKKNNSTILNDFFVPKTMQTELRKIYRMEKYRRNFPFTNQYVQKGIQQEEEGITLLQTYRNLIGEKTLFTKNKERIKNGWVSGEPDLGLFGVPINQWKEGWDIKCSWSLESFPFKDDNLLQGYEDQNLGYMWLTGAEKWTTSYVLVNCSEHQLNNEKMKWFYACEMPADANDKYWDDYQEKCKEVEKMMIYDYERFVKHNPHHDLVISKEEWFGEGYDIPIEERVLEKTSYMDDKKITFYKERILFCREYLMILDEL